MAQASNVLDPVTNALIAGAAQRHGLSASVLTRVATPNTTASHNPEAHAAPGSPKAIVTQAAQKYGIDPAILWGVWGTEAGFSKNPGTSSAGAIGPFQFEPSTAKGMGVNPLDFTSAAYGAAKYLSQYKARGTAGMLSAYNAGPNGQLQPQYVNSVLEHAKSFGGPGPSSATAAPVSAPPVSEQGTGKQAAVRGALLATLLKSGGKPLTSAALLSAAETPAPTPTQSQLSNQPARGNPTLTNPAAPAGPTVTSLKYLGAAPSSLLGAGSTYVGPDQGLDFTNPGRQVPVKALGDAVVTRVVPSGSGWAGQGGLLVYRLTSGPNAGRYVYTAEDFLPTSGLRVGSTIRAGDVIGVATGANKAPGIETGFAQNAAGQAYGNEDEGKGGRAPDPQAIAFANFVQSQAQRGVKVHVNAKGKVIPYRTNS